VTAWTQDLDAQLRALWAQDDPRLSTNEIGRRMGLTKNAVVGRAHRLKLPSRPSPINGDGRPWTAAEEADLRQLRAAGWQVQDIAARLDRNFDTVRNRLWQLRIRAPAPGQRNDGVRALVARGAAVVARAQQNSIGAAEGFRTRGAEGGGSLSGGFGPAAHSIPAEMAGDPGPGGSPGGAPRRLPCGASEAMPSSTLTLPPAPSHAPAVLFSKTCRFPLWGDRDRPDHRFCGDPTALGSYCAEHAARCYVPAHERTLGTMGRTVGWGGR
jgi:GcrA cell cycle regulator